MAPSSLRKPPKGGHSGNTVSECLWRARLKRGPRKNHITCTKPVFNNLKFWRKQIRPRYGTKREYDANHFLHLVTVCHHADKADLKAILEDEGLVGILEEHYKDFDVYKAWQKVCNACSDENKRALITFEGSVQLCAKAINDPNDRERWCSLGLRLRSMLESLLRQSKTTGEEVVYSNVVGLNVTPELAVTERRSIKKPNLGSYQKKEKLVLGIESLKGLLGPLLRSGMMSTDYRKSELRGWSVGGVTTALSIRKPVSDSGDCVLQIITSATGAGNVCDALKSSSEGEEEEQEEEDLRLALGHRLYRWMEDADCGKSWRQKDSLPPVWVDRAERGDDQIVTVMVHSNAYRELLNMNSEATAFMY